MRILVAFAKEGVARYVSHLDLLRAMQRAIRRSGLPVKYSSGFNPHQVIAFASAMSVGMASGGEWLDIALMEDVPERECAAVLGPAMPPGITLLEAHGVEDKYPALMKITARADYEWRLRPEKAEPLSLWRERTAAILAQPLMAEKKSKKGPRQVDLREYIVDFALLTEEEGDALRFALTLVHASEGALNPNLLLPALLERWQAVPLESDVRRTALWALKGGKKVPVWSI